jgi:hypothetical protein
LQPVFTLGAEKLFSPVGILVLSRKLNRAKLIHGPRYRLALASGAAPLGRVKLLPCVSRGKVLGQFVAPRVDAVAKQLLCLIALPAGLC